MDDRKFFAALAMQGILSFSNEMDWVANCDPELKPTIDNLACQVAEVAVIFADALTKRLKETSNADTVA